MTKIARLVAVALLALAPSSADAVSSAVVAFGTVTHAWAVTPATPWSPRAGVLLLIASDTDPDVQTLALCPPLLAARCTRLANLGDHRVVVSGSMPRGVLLVDYVARPQP